MSIIMTGTGVLFSMFCLFYYEFDVPHGGTNLCYFLLVMCISVWLRPFKEKAKLQTGHAFLRYQAKLRTDDDDDEWES